MSINAPNIPTTSPATDRCRGRAYFWAGIAACLLGVALVYVQFRLKHLFVPWYSPVLATVGAVLLLLSVARRWSILRVIALVLVAVLAGFEWYVVASFLKLPDYEGPVRAGQKLPSFSATLASGRTFTEADLQDGSRRVMVFFRGRW